ncbi:MAG TPA: glycosyltransferase [Solirubrobacteraceae bacterium]|nr:glycosyltransferase [Solirubrobacteraceae bacterium]
MRVLLATRGSSGHFLPLAPFGHACRRAGDEVLVAAQRQHAANVERTGLALAPVGDPPPEEWIPLMAQFGQLGIDEANERMIADFFGRIDLRAALPDLRAIVEDFRPDVIVRESWEFAAPLVADLYGIPIVRVGLGLADVEARTVALAAPAVDEQRVMLGLPPDPAGIRLGEMPYFTMVPGPLDDSAASAPQVTHRFASTALGSAAAAAAPPPLADWFPDNDDPLVYVSFGSVAAGEHLPYFPAVYQAAIAALAPLSARILVTIGNDRDPAELGALPDNVRVERWVAQDAIAPHAAAIICHGGYGSTLGALRHGVPLVVLPLFSFDQWANAAAVQRSGAGMRSIPTVPRVACWVCQATSPSAASRRPWSGCCPIRPTPPPRAVSRRPRRRCRASTRPSTF